MHLSTGTVHRLLGAIEADSLVFLCGAGLSRPAPSDLFSAVDVARACYDKWNPIEALDPDFRDDLDSLAGHFFASGRFHDVFLNMVPWTELVGVPNVGHAAITDLLVIRAARAALTSNFDCLIENWAEAHKVDLRGALTGEEAVNAGTPLLKFHGCMRLRRDLTLWTHQQLTEHSIDERVRSCSQWMNLILPGKHLVVVGFWTDWGYLNDVLSQAFAVNNAASVTVIDPKETTELEANAPDLWNTLNGLSALFEHVKGSGAEALDELREAFSRVWTRRYYALGTGVAQRMGATVAVPAPFDSLGGEDLYRVRCDAEGTPYGRAARLKAPPDSAQQAAHFQVRLLNAGATPVGPWLDRDGESIRVINGGGQDLASVRERYREPPASLGADVCVAAGSRDLGVPGRVVSAGLGLSAVRPAPGAGMRWLTDLEAAAEFGV